MAAAITIGMGTKEVERMEFEMCKVGIGPEMCVGMHPND